MEIAFWRDVISLLPELGESRVMAELVQRRLTEKCHRSLPHQVGQVLTDTILTCFDFKTATEGMNDYQAHMYFKTKVLTKLNGVFDKV